MVIAEFREQVTFSIAIEKYKTHKEMNPNTWEQQKLIIQKKIAKSMANKESNNLDK